MRILTKAIFAAHGDVVRAEGGSEMMPAFNQIMPTLPDVLAKIDRKVAGSLIGRKNPMRPFVRLISVIVSAPLFAYAADVASAPHMCVIASSEDFSKATMSQLTSRVCSALLMASLADEDGQLIRVQLDSKKWDATNRKEWADIMARGMHALAERNLCVDTAAKAREVFLRRFKHEPQCNAINKK